MKQEANPSVAVNNQVQTESSKDISEDGPKRVEAITRTGNEGVVRKRPKKRATRCMSGLDIDAVKSFHIKHNLASNIASLASINEVIPSEAELTENDGLQKIDKITLSEQGREAS